MKTLQVDHAIVGAGIAGLWLARRLLSMGRSVAMIEVGPRSADGTRPAHPPLHFPERRNIGAVMARNHMLTGNSSFWGGALLRNDDPSLRGMFDLGDDAAGAKALGEFASSYDAVERQLKAPASERSILPQAPHPARLAEVNVLAGRHRNLARTVLGSCAEHPQFTLLCPATVADVELTGDGGIAAMTATSDDGSPVVIRAAHFVLSAGVIDSNLFVMTHLSRALGDGAQTVGTRLHDHWSLPIARLRWKRGANLEWLFPPSFRGGFIQGRRVEISAPLPWGEHSGFLHIQAQYDLVEPYATIKRWMAARQEGQSWFRQARFVWPLAGQAPRMARIAYNRLVNKRLWLAEGMELTVVMDFESFASPHNRLALDGGEHHLHWDVREQDVSAFEALLCQGTDLMSHWQKKGGLDLEFLVERETPGAQGEYLRTHAVDAYHLGGGLAVGRNSTRGLLSPDLRFHKIPNLAVVGTAAFARPGIANPVETLLALCERYVSAL